MTLIYCPGEEVPLIPLSIINHRKRWLGRETARYPSCCQSNCPCCPCRLRRFCWGKLLRKSVKQLISHISQEAAEGSLETAPQHLNPGITAWGENVASLIERLLKEIGQMPTLSSASLSAKVPKFKKKKKKKRECSWGFLKASALTCHCHYVHKLPWATPIAIVQKLAGRIFWI